MHEGQAKIGNRPGKTVLGSKLTTYARAAARSMVPISPDTDVSV
jgi:hypothetical protein